MKNLSLAAALAAAAIASSASAQELYYGGGLTYTHGESTPEFGGTATLDAPMLSLIVGQRYGAGSGSTFWGWEANGDFSFGADTDGPGVLTTCGASAGADGPYLCQQQATVRVVGVYGTALANGMEVFGTLGFGALLGDFATSSSTSASGSVYGATVSLGLSREVATNMAVRGEVIYDKFDTANQSGGFVSNYTGTTVRLALIRKF